ncbi:hypothetical protein [Cellulomonas soli]
MTGCRVGAKNTLVKNYLHLAERAGATVVPMTTVTRLRPVGVPPPTGGWWSRVARATACVARGRPRTWCSRRARTTPSCCCTGRGDAVTCPRCRPAWAC